MKSFKSLFVLGAMAMASSMAWAQGTAYNEGCVSTLPTEATKQAYVLSTPRGTLIGTENQYLQATDLPANNTTYAYDKTNGAFQFLLFPVEGQTNGYYVYNVGTEKFLGTRTTANTKDSYTTGVAPMTADAPAVYYIWKHGQTGSTSQGYSGNFNKQDWPWTIGSSVRTSGNWNTINMTHWNNGVGYDFGSTGSLDGGNAYAIVPAVNVSDEVYREAYHTAYGEYPSAATPEEIQALQEKIDALTPVIGKVGYPSWEASVTTALLPYNSNYGLVNAENYETAEAALEAYYNSTDVVLPEADKYYEIKAVYHDGAKQYLGFDGTKLSITDAKPMGGSVTFKAESVEGSNIVLSIDGHYVHWTAGDDPKKTADTDGLNEELDPNLNTLVLSKATSGNSTPMATTENLFGLFQIQGKSSGSVNTNNLFYFVTRNDLAGYGNYVAGNAGDKFFDDNWDHNGHNRTTYFEITEVEAPSVDLPATAEEIESAQQLLWNADRLGYPKGDDPVVAALNDAVNKTGVTATELGAAVLAYKNCENVVLPEKNQFYQIQGASTSGLIGGGVSGNAVKLDAEQIYADPQTVDLSSLYYYSEEGYLINYNGGRALKGSAIAGVNETPDVYTFCHETLTEPGTLSIKNQEGKYLIDVNHNLATTDAPVGAATNWNVNAYGYAPIAVGSTGYATAYLPYNLVSAPEYGIEAVYVVYEDGDVLQAEEIGCIPARVPVIVKTNGEQRCFGKGMGGSDSWEPSAEAQTSIAKNVLSGSLLAIAKPSEALVLGYEDEQIGFYGFSGSVLAGFKAYYENPAGASNLRIRFDDTLTAIESAVETAQGHQIFDLQGRRVNGAAHGLFIQNGKKVIK